jgi:hypothetical protein
VDERSSALAQDSPQRLEVSSSEVDLGQSHRFESLRILACPVRT